jgi:hypothetical protein
MSPIIKKTTLLLPLICLTVVAFAQVKDTTKSQKTGLDLIEEIQRDIELQKRKQQQAQQNTPSVSTPSAGNNEPRYYPAPAPKPKKEPLKLYHHELQLEVGAFFNQLFTVFGLTDTGKTFTPSDYFIAYKYKPQKTDKAGAIRIGLGGGYRKIKETQGGFADNKQTTISSYGGRVGYEFQKRLATEFVWTVGGDVLLMQRTNKSVFDSGIDQVTNLKMGWERGFALMTGLRWDFGEKTSIGTEVNLRFLQFRGQEENRFTANPQFNKLLKTIEEDRAAEFVGPANIYLSVRF